MNNKNIKNIDNNIKTIYAIYDDDYFMMKSIKFIRKENIYINEVYTPFPIHNLDKELGLKKTNIPFLSFIYGIFGIIIGCLLTWYTMIYDWPQNIGGKPYNKWYINLPSFIPVIFEIAIFCSAHFICITYLFSCKLFPWSISKNPDPRTTDDKFLIEINIDIKKIDYLINKLKKQGAIEISIKDFKK